MMYKIERLKKDDYADWLPLWQGYLAFYKANVAADTTQNSFARLTGGDEPMGGFILRDETGHAQGIVHWIMHRSTWTQGDYCYLQDLFVADSGRGKGAGRALIEAVAAKAIAHDCSRVYWLTHETNLDAIALYNKVASRSGFIQFVRKLV
ncbi:MAG: GNAT family N-acetyltransferase [Hyphomicrobiales bacterium]|nr:GNAT family N-acetyltransferase [Hyphomicrobiales bacterium]MDE2114934.1 GNAT family N-acetyltransferase [Hyphomicrobiales bacterium]